MFEFSYSSFKKKDVLRLIKSKIIDNQNLIILTALFFFIISPIIYFRFTSNRYINKAFGYEVIIPPHWYLKVSDDYSSLVIRDQFDESLATNFIHIDVLMGNPYGTTALDYILNGHIPQLRYDYEMLGQSVISFTKKPSKQKRRRRNWATAKYIIDYYNESQIVYVTLANDNIYRVIYKTKDYSKNEKVKVFYRFLDTILIHNIREKNYFIDQ